MNQIKKCQVIFILVVIVVAVPPSYSQVIKETERLEIVRQFASALKENSFSNEEIIEKFVEAVPYFGHDSLTLLLSSTDYLNSLREKLRTCKDSNLLYSKYSDGAKKTLQNLSPSFLLAFDSETSDEINLNDLYLIRDVSNKHDEDIMVLFNDTNKIISFSNQRYRDQVILFQWSFSSSIDDY
jgi:hypothetical protein